MWSGEPVPAQAQGPSSLCPASSGGIKAVSPCVCHKHSLRLGSCSVCRGKKRAPRCDPAADRTELLPELSILPCPWACLSSLLLPFAPGFMAVFWLEGRRPGVDVEQGSSGWGCSLQGQLWRPRSSAWGGPGWGTRPTVAHSGSSTALSGPRGEGSGLPVLSASATWTGSWPCGEPTSCPAAPSPSRPSPANTTSAPRMAPLPFSPSSSQTVS